MKLGEDDSLNGPWHDRKGMGNVGL